MADTAGVFTAIIPAAGEGRRAGGYKPLRRIGSCAVIDLIIEAASSVCGEVRVVGGACFDELSRYVKEKHPDVALLNNVGWAEGGMFSSIRIGARDLGGPAFVHPADMPGAGAAVYRRLAAEYANSESEVVRPVCRGRGGHPVLLGPSAVRAVLSAPPDSNLRLVIANLKQREILWDDDLPCIDFDTPKQYEELAARLSIKETP